MLTARTEATDRMLIFSERHLRSVLAEYAAHYHRRRPQRSRQLRPPQPGESVAGLSQEQIKRRPVLGGLINEYPASRIEAQVKASGRVLAPHRLRQAASLLGGAARDIAVDIAAKVIERGTGLG